MDNKNNKKQPIDHNIHDKTLKELFTRPEIVRDFLVGFADEQEFVKDTDLSSIHAPNKSYITELFQERENDVVLEITLKNGDCAYLLIFFEFQSSPDRFITLRILTYILLLYQELITHKEIKGDDLLPPVFPVLIYTDKDNLTAPIHIEDLIAQPYKRLMKYLPKFEIFKLTFKELQDEADKLDGLIENENLLAAILSFLIARDEIEGKKRAKLLQDTINKNPDIAMRKFIGFWFKGYSNYKKWNIKIDINEGGIAMIDTVFEQVMEKGKAEGMEKGIEKGKAEGELNKSRNIARNLLKMNMSLEQIAQATELSVEEIQMLITES